MIIQAFKNDLIDFKIISKKEPFIKCIENIFGEGKTTFFKAHESFRLLITYKLTIRAYSIF